jgi:hypothetical protein
MIFKNKLQKYRWVHRIELSEKRRKHYKDNIEKFRLEGRKRYANPKNKIREKAYKNESKRVNKWIGLISKKTKCMICNKDLYFIPQNKKESIVFDHRNGGREPIKRKPSNWLRSNTRTPENEKLWNKCKFGVLCRKCNMFLPTNTDKRNMIARSIVRYVYGESAVIINKKEFKRRKDGKK